MLLMMVGVSAWGGTPDISWSVSGNSESYTNGYTLASNLKTAASGYRQDNTTSQTYYLSVYHASKALFTSTPTSVKVTLKVGGGTANKELSSPIYACLVDNGGNDIANTEVAITSKITTVAGDTYADINIPVAGVSKAYGVKIYHTKTLSYNCRFYSMSATVETSGVTLASLAVSGAPTKTTYTEGETFDPTGLTVTGTYSDGSQKKVASGINWTVTPSTGLVPGTTSVSVVASVGLVNSSSYTVNGLTVNAIPTYRLYIEQPEVGGTLTVKNGDTPIADGASVRVGTNLTCEVTDIPEGKRLSRFYVRYDNDGEKYKTTNPATFDNIPTEGITAATVSVTYQNLAQYTVAWNVNGIEVKSETVYEGTVISAPKVENINNKVFMGWAETSSVNAETGDLVIPSTIAAKTVSYYAVFAMETSAANESIATLNAAGKSTSGYNKDSKNDDEGNVWTYNASINNQSGTFYFGLNTNASNYNIASPDFGLNITGIQIKGYNGSSSQDRKLLICSSNSKAQPTEGDIAEVAIARNEKFTTTYDVDLSNAKSFSQFYIYAAAALGVSEVKVTYGTPAIYSDYTTTVSAPEPEPTSGTINLVAQGVMPGVNNEGGMMDGLNLYFATFSHGKDVIITGDDLFAVCPVGVDEGYLSTLPCEQSMAAVTDQEVMDEEGCAIGYFVPANTGVLVVSMGNEATYYFPVADPSNMISDFDPEGINMLQPASKDKAELPNHKFYMLAYGDNSKNPASLGFYWGKADGAAFASREGSAYLAVPTDSNVKGFSFSSIADAIKNVEVKNNNGAIYNLQGQRVEKAQKGLYIVNGKKVVVK